MARIRNLGNLEIYDAQGALGHYRFLIELDRAEAWMDEVSVDTGNGSLHLEQDGRWTIDGDERFAKDEIVMRQNLITEPLGKFIFQVAKTLGTSLGVGVYRERGKTFLDLMPYNQPKVEKPSLYIEALSRKMSVIWQDICTGRAPATPSTKPVNGVALELLRINRSDHVEVLLELFAGVEATPLQREILNWALPQVKVKGLEFIDVVSENDLEAEPHSIRFSCRTSLTEKDCFSGSYDNPTQLGRYLESVHGWPYNHEVYGPDPTFEGILEEHYWSPEWPTPVSMTLCWEDTNKPSDHIKLAVFCSVATDDQLIHLLFGNRLEAILTDMLPFLEEFLTQKLELVLRPDPLSL